MSLHFPTIDDDFPVLVPPLKKFLEHLHECEKQDLPLSNALNDLQTCDVVLSALLSAFKQSADKSFVDEQEMELLAQALNLFTRLGEIISVTYRSLAGNEHDLTIVNVVALMESIRQLDVCLARQREYRANKPKFSEVPGLNSVLQAGEAVLQGQRNWKFLENALDSFRPLVTKMSANSYNPPYVTQHLEAMQRLFKCCARKNLEKLPDLLELVKSTGEAFMNINTAQTEKIAEADFACPFCGAMVGKWDKKCPQCNTKMPDRSYELDVVPTESFELPRYLEEIARISDSLRTEDGDLDDFYSKVENVYKSTIYVNQRLLSLATITSDSSREECDLVVSVRTALNDGEQQLEQAIELFNSLVMPVDEDILDNGLELLVSAVENTRQATLDVRDLEKLRGRACSY